MNADSGSFFLGRWFGINVRVHFTLLIVIIYRIQDIVVEQGYFLGKDRFWIAAVVVLGFFLSILLHEFGHSLACRFFKGDADEILMWPLGGLAYCRPPFHPTAHLVTTVAGPMVTLVLWLLLEVVVPQLHKSGAIALPGQMLVVSKWLGNWNYFLLLFNLLPAFPMDGGRALRDLLWHFVGYTKATLFAVWLGRVIGALMVACGLGVIPEGVLPAVFQSGIWMVLLGAFVLYNTMHLEALMGAESSGADGYSLKEHWRHARRSSDFRKKAEAAASDALHHCTVCHRTELTDPALEFRVSAADEQEYCLDHLPKRQGRSLP